MDRDGELNTIVIVDDSDEEERNGQKGGGFRSGVRGEKAEDRGESNGLRGRKEDVLVDSGRGVGRVGGGERGGIVADDDVEEVIVLNDVVDLTGDDIVPPPPVFRREHQLFPVSTEIYYGWIRGGEYLTNAAEGMEGKWNEERANLFVGCKRYYRLAPLSESTTGREQVRSRILLSY